MSYWFGFYVGNLETEQIHGLWANLPRVQAQDRLRTGRYDDLDPDAVYDLFMSAHGDEDMAQNAATQAAKNLVRYEAANAKRKALR